MPRDSFCVVPSSPSTFRRHHIIRWADLSLRGPFTPFLLLRTAVSIFEDSDARESSNTPAAVNIVAHVQRDEGRGREQEDPYA